MPDPDPLDGLPDWLPTPEDVHAIIPTRGRGQPFTADTIPTVDQVKRQIRGAYVEVIAETFDPLPSLHDLAWRTVAMRAAYLIELSLYPEQTRDPENTLALRLRSRDLIARLRMKNSDRRRKRLPEDDERRSDAPDYDEDDEDDG